MLPRSRYRRLFRGPVRFLQSNASRGLMSHNEISPVFQRKSPVLSILLTESSACVSENVKPRRFACLMTKLCCDIMATLCIFHYPIETEELINGNQPPECGRYQAIHRR
jgi:hypothetical protein